MPNLSPTLCHTLFYPLHVPIVVPIIVLIVVSILTPVNTQSISFRRLSDSTSLPPRSVSLCWPYWNRFLVVDYLRGILTRMREGGKIKSAICATVFSVNICENNLTTILCKQKWNLNFRWIFKKLRWRLLAICCTGALPLPLLFIFMILSHQKLTHFTLYFLTFQWKKGKQINWKKTKQRTANWGQAALTAFSAKLGGKVLSILHFVLSSAA